MKPTPFCRSLLYACLAAALISAAEAKTLQLYILTGQSNSLGAVKGSPASAELLEQYKSDGSTKFWHNNFNKIRAIPWITILHPLPPGAPSLPRYAERPPVLTTAWGRSMGSLP